jgi:solute carrier family 25 phosphate transporter 23/24/25/41
MLAEFRTFVHETEKELLALFKSIDYNNDGKISKPELRAALGRAGLAVPNSNLDTFFTEVDTNNDGTITFDEWRYVYAKLLCTQAGSRLQFWRITEIRG